MTAGDQVVSNVAKSSRALIIGIDGAEFDILRPLIAEGVMPNLKGIFERGVCGHLQTTMPPITAGAWTSFATGVNPGKHGLVDFVHFPGNGYNVGVANSSDVRARTMWEIAGEQGRRVGIVGVPMTYPPRPVQGFLLTDFLTPPSSDNYCYPPELREEIEATFGRFITNAGEGIAPRNLHRFTLKLLHDVPQRVQVATHLMERFKPDLAVFVFQCLDGIQHRFSRILDPANPHHDPAEARRYQADLAQVYRAVDDGIGRLCSATGEDATVFVVSDHGFGPLHGFIHLNNWLHRQGYLVLRRDPVTTLRHAAFRLGFTPELGHELSQRLGLDLRYKVNRGQSFQSLRRIFLSFANVDWSRTRAYSLGHVGQVFINLKGRQPQGIVAPGGEYESLRDELIQALLELRHLDTGEKLIARAYRREELYQGSELDHLPDILLEPDGFRYMAFGESEFASNRIVGPSFGHSGHHRMAGVLAACGPGIRNGGGIEDAAIVDIAPTVLYTIGCSIPSSFEGRVLTDLFCPEHLQTRAPQYVTSQDAGGMPATPARYSEDEEASVRERLRSLGYIA